MGSFKWHDLRYRIHNKVYDSLVLQLDQKAFKLLILHEVYILK